jgi:PAS domain S-box-containing protein
MFKNSSLRIKLTVAFLVIAVLLAGVSYYQLQAVHHLNNVFLDLIDKDFARLDALNQLELSSLKLQGQTLEYQHEVFESESVGPQEHRQAVVRFAQDLKRNEQTYLVLTKRDNPNISRQQLNALTSASSLVVQRSTDVINTTNDDPHQHTLENLEDKLVQAQDQLGSAINSIVKAEDKGINREDAEADKTVARILLTIVSLTIATAVLAVVLGVSMATWISRSLSKLRAGAERIAHGDFSQPIPITSNDEIGQLAATFNVMAEKLQNSYQQLAVESQRDEAILQSMGEGLVALDEKGRVVLTNRVAADLFGISDIAEVTNKNIEELLQQYHITDIDDAPLTLEQTPTYKTLATGAEFSDTFIFHAPDDKKVLFNITSSPVKVEEKIVGAVVIFRDVTKEKEVDRMKTEFISLASHQLRTPLSAIKWFSEMLVSGDAGKLSSEQLDFANNIADSTERMIALVNALLNISRIESGRIMVNPKPTDLRELVSGIINDLKAKTEEKQQTLVISVHDGLPKISLDPQLIGQVYLNLLTNAIKYTKKGGEISVFISKKGNEIISQVTDNGYGIPKDQQAHVFQKFFRAANAVKVETDGTGLGLYLIKAVVESSGGKIWFESQENKGTTFWFSIPLSGMKAKKGEVTLET